MGTCVWSASQFWKLYNKFSFLFPCRAEIIRDSEGYRMPVVWFSLWCRAVWLQWRAPGREWVAPYVRLRLDLVELTRLEPTLLFFRSDSPSWWWRADRGAGDSGLRRLAASDFVAWRWYPPATAQVMPWWWHLPLWRLILASWQTTALPNLGWCNIWNEDCTPVPTRINDYRSINQCPETIGRSLLQHCRQLYYVSVHWTLQKQPDGISLYLLYRFYEQYEKRSPNLDSFEDFYRQYVPPITSRHHTCVGLGFDLVDRILLLERDYPGLRSALFLSSCEEVI